VTAQADHLTVEQRLRAVEDKEAITETINSYGPALDDERRDDYLDLWADGASLIWPGSPAIVGRDAIGAAFDAHRRPQGARRPMHVVSNLRITLDGDRAEATSYWVRFNGDDGRVRPFAYGRYRDLLVRCPDGRWRFSERSTEAAAVEKRS
jgi:ketosteroid isomerase-like protein